MKNMEILSSSSRISKTILAILSLVLLTNIPSQAQDLLPKHRPTLHELFAPQIGEGNWTKTYDSILKFLNSPSFPKRSSFPDGFLFGAGSSALQIEGGSHEGGRGLGIWDDRIERNKGMYRDYDKLSTKIDHYKRYKEDVQHLKKLGVNSYRMSISWSRVMPDGTLEGGINQEGINFYNNLINELLNNGIEPFVTILHFDFPLALQQKLGGFLNHSIVKHYKDFSELLFKTYGDRVKHWTTINEVEVTALFQYMHNFDNMPVEACQTTRICSEAYIVLHNFLIAHATVSKLYKTKFKAKQGGEIGLVLSSGSYVPYSSQPEDVLAAQRLMDFYMGWILEPVFHGNYPKIMRKLVGNRLPKFTKHEKKMIKGSTDFIGINYYSSHFAIYEPNRTMVTGADNYDALARSVDFNSEGKTVGYKDQYGWNFVYPEGLYNVLHYIKKKYNNPKVYITENGIASFEIPNPLKDEHRIAYLAAHINATKAAIDDGVNVRGYFVWSAFDTFEFQAGYAGHWGLYHVDFNNSLKRVPTDAAKWYRKYLTHDLEHYNILF